MPPTGPLGSPPQFKAATNRAQKLEPYYNVAILRDIVVLAQELLPTLPERERLPTFALFGAYDDILPRIGIDIDHDSRYARVLFKIGGLRGPGTLYEKFEEVLSTMGIEIEFDDIQDAIEKGSQIETFETGAYDVEASEIHSRNGNYTARSRRRRNSESTAKDLEAPNQTPFIARRNSHSSGDKLPDELHDNIVFNGPPPNGKPAATSSKKTEDENYSECNIGTWLESGAEVDEDRNHGRSASAHTDIRQGRESALQPAPTVIPSVPTSNEHEAQSEFTADTSYLGEDLDLEQDDSAHDIQEGQTLVGRETLFHNALICLENHLRSLAKRHLRIWRDKVSRSREDNLGLNLLATHFYNRKILLRASLDVWRLQASKLRQERINEDFFQYLELRATRARNFYLLNLSFSHWLKYAQEQVQRTAVARRHIVRRRVFDAWRDVTAVDELKCRRHVLRKFFSIWKRQHRAISNADGISLQRYQVSIAGKCLGQWVQNLWKLKAAAWYEDGVKRRALFHWIVASHENWENQRIAEGERRLKLQSHAWNTWLMKNRINYQQIYDADAHYKTALLRTVFEKWCKETLVTPAKITVQADVSARLCRETFGIWLHRARQQKTALSVDRTRILREALTRWRHQTRYQILEAYVNKRLKSRAFYRIFTTFMATKVVKNRDEHLFRGAFQVLRTRWAQVREQRLEQEQSAEMFAVRRSQNLALARWYAQMEYRKRLEVASVERYYPRLLERIFFRWSEHAQHQQQMRNWSKDAGFYFLAKKILNNWKSSTESVKREKRKNAYALVRRRVKVNLVQKVLRIWRSQANRFIFLQSQALTVRENRNVILGMEIFDRWRGRTEELVELESSWKETVVRKHFSAWKEKSDRLRAFETEASITHHERCQTRVIRKWSLTSLQLRAQTNYAADICEKNAKKRFRRMFTYWHQIALQRRPSQHVETSESDQLLGTTARAETWSDYGGDGGIDEWAKGLDEATFSTPLPGYLATPSKVNRAERVMAVAARFSTTPKAPISTPLARQLRAQWSGGQISSLRKGSVRRGLAGGFEDIPEHSMNNEKEKEARE